MKSLEIRGSHSGHTLVAAMLDCHPNIIMANTYGKALSVYDVLDSSSNVKKWDGLNYKFIHPYQQQYKPSILLVGNTDKMINPDYTILIVRDPYVMVNSLLKKHKEIKKVIEFMDNLFEKMEYIVFYEDIIKNPINELITLSNLFCIRHPDYWLTASKSLIQKDIEQPRIDVDLSKLFDKYEWLGRYK